MKSFFVNLKTHTLLIFASIALLFSIAVGTTVAYIITKTDSFNNSFTPPVVRISVDGIDDITNTGNVPVYVRAFSFATWLSKEDEHTILAEKPEYKVDYDITLLKEGWFLASDGFYYYEKPLLAGESVMLFTEAYQLREKEGYELRLQLLSSSIQTDPIDTILHAWPAVTIDENGYLKPQVAP